MEDEMDRYRYTQNGTECPCMEKRIDRLARQLDEKERELVAQKTREERFKRKVLAFLLSLRSGQRFRDSINGKIFYSERFVEIENECAKAD